MLKDIKSVCGRYSFLDHFHPHTGATLGDIVSNQNCTSLIRVFEKLSNPTTNFIKAVGDNPTPQLITKVLRENYFKLKLKDDEPLEIQNDEVFSNSYRRSC